MTLDEAAGESALTSHDGVHGLLWLRCHGGARAALDRIRGPT